MVVVIKNQEDKEGIVTVKEIRSQNGWWELGKSLNLKSKDEVDNIKLFLASYVEEHFVRKENITMAIARIPFSNLSVKDRVKFKEIIGLKGEKD